MSIDLPDNPKELESRIKTDVQRQLPQSNPFLKNSFLGALITGFSLRIFDFYTQLGEVIKQMFVQTATGDFLVMFGSWFGTTRNVSTQSSGNVVATGNAGASIPIGSGLQSGENLQYAVLTEAVISTDSLSVSSITRSGTIATVTTAGNHNLASLINVTISGATQSDYNGTFSITVVDANEFTYPVENSPTTPATGTILSTQTTTLVSVQSVDFGQDTNQILDAPLTLTNPIAGVTAVMRVDVNELAGGTDVEADVDFRGRVIDRVQNPVTMFNVAAIVNQARLIPGVTRVFVEEITPDVGQVTIYFVRDDDLNIIPTGTEVADVKNSILLIKPAHTSDADVIVAAPIPVPVDFTFSSLDPGTPSMRSALKTRLGELLSNTNVGVDLAEDQYRSAILSTVDRESGDTIISFGLSAPIGNITVNAGELATLGTVTFN